MLQLGIKVIQTKAMYWLVLKKEKYSDKKKRKKENILLTARRNGFLQSKLCEAGNTGRPRNAASKDKGFYKSWIKKLYAIIDHLMYRILLDNREKLDLKLLQSFFGVVPLHLP